MRNSEYSHANVIRRPLYILTDVYTGWPKKVSLHQFKKIVLKIANYIRFLRKVNQAL